MVLRILFLFSFIFLSGCNYSVECNSFETVDGKVQGLISTIYNGKENLPDQLLLSFFEIPLDIFKDGKAYGEIIPYKKKDGKNEFRFAPVRFIYVNKDSGKPVYRAFADRIAKSSFSVAMGMGKLGDKYNEVNFLYNFALILDDITEDWTHASIRFYNNDSMKKMLHEIDVQLPPYRTDKHQHEESERACEKMKSDTNVPRPNFSFLQKFVRKINNRM